MIPVTVRELAAMLGAAVVPSPGAAPAQLDRPVTGLAVDSRQVADDTLFLALPGEHVDGHDYVAAAFGLAALGLPYWAAFLIVAGVLLLLAAILGLIGYSRIKKVKAPEKTIANAQALVSELSTAVNRATAAAGAPRIEGTVVNDTKALR